MGTSELFYRNSVLNGARSPVSSLGEARKSILKPSWYDESVSISTEFPVST